MANRLHNTFLMPAVFSLYVNGVSYAVQLGDSYDTWAAVTRGSSGARIHIWYESLSAPKYRGTATSALLVPLAPIIYLDLWTNRIYRYKKKSDFQCSEEHSNLQSRYKLPNHDPTHTFYYHSISKIYVREHSLISLNRNTDHK